MDDHPNEPGVADCADSLKELYTFLDGELTTERRTHIRKHLDGCQDCYEAFDFEAELRIVVSTKCREEVPDELRARVAGGGQRAPVKRNGDVNVTLPAGFDRERKAQRSRGEAGRIGDGPRLGKSAAAQKIDQRPAAERHGAEAIGVDTFKARAEKLGNFSFVLHNSTTDGRFDASKLVAGTSMDPAEADLWFCGPPPLRMAIEKGLRELGKPPRRVEFERFEFR